MARDFPEEPLTISVPLGTTWEEDWELTDDAGPVDLTGYEFRMMLRDRSGALLMTIDSTSPEPRATLLHAEGVIRIRVEAVDVSALSPLNEKLSTRWDAELYKADGYVIPVVRGSATFKPRQTFPVIA